MLSWIFKFVLYCMGWQPLNKEILAIIKNSRQTVCVFSHTSYWDFWIMLLYMFAHPSLWSSLNVVVKPQPFEYAGPLLRKLGCIPGTKVADKNGGSVQTIVDNLKKKPFGSILIISPKGTIMKREWRTGYYHIARALSAPLMAIGLDFEKKNVFVSERISSSFSEPEVREFLFEELGKVVPLIPEREIMKIRNHDSSKVGVTDPPEIVRIIPSLIMWYVVFSWLVSI